MTKRITLTLILTIAISTKPCLSKIPFQIFSFSEKKTSENPSSLNENKLGYENNDYLVLYNSDKIHLLDMDGVILNQWDLSYSKRIKFLDDCSIMVLENNDDKFLVKKDFSDNTIWRYEAPGITHHDFDITKEGNIIFLYRTTLSKKFKLDNECKHSQVTSDAIMEITPEGKQVFQWSLYENFGSIINTHQCTDENLDYKKELDWAHPNSIDIIKENKWYKKGHKAFKPGNIIITLRHLNKVAILDKETKDIVWDYSGEEDGYSLEFPHEGEMIPEGLPGAGNILIFDNGSVRKFTRVIEINPITKKTIWSYSDPGNFFNPYAGSHKRLKNSDTYISDDESSKAFIVDKKGRIKWQYKDSNSTLPVKRPTIFPKKDFAHCFSKESN